MTLKEKRYRVTTGHKSIYQILAEAASAQEAEYFAEDIDSDKRKRIETHYEIVVVSKDYFFKELKMSRVKR